VYIIMHGQKNIKMPNCIVVWVIFSKQKKILYQHTCDYQLLHSRAFLRAVCTISVIINRCHTYSHLWQTHFFFVLTRKSTNKMLQCPSLVTCLLKCAEWCVHNGVGCFEHFNLQNNWKLIFFVIVMDEWILCSGT